MKSTLELDEKLVAEALLLTGKRTKGEVVDLALQELVRSRRKRDLTELAGRIQFREDFDHKSLRVLRRLHRPAGARARSPGVAPRR